MMSEFKRVYIKSFRAIAYAAVLSFAFLAMMHNYGFSPNGYEW